MIREVGSKGDDDLYRIEVRNRVEVGDEIEVVVPPAKGADGENVKVKIGEMISLNDEKVDAAHGGDKDVYFRLEKGLPEGGLLRIYMS